MKVAEADLTAENTFCDGVAPAGTVSGVRRDCRANLSITGTWTGTLTLQRAFDGGTTYHDIEAFTENAQRQIEDNEVGVSYRVGFKSGDFGSGEANVRISR